MGVFRKAVSKNPARRGTNEPYAAIRYDGSYGTAGQILSFIGLKRLSFEDGDCGKLAEKVIGGENVLDRLLDKMMDNDSNLSLPEIVGSREERVYSSRPRVLRVDSWIMAFVDNRGIVEFTILSNDEFLAHFQLV